MDNNTNRNTNRNNPKNDRDNKNQKKNQIIGIVVALVAAFLFTTLSSYIVDSMTTKEISYNQFIALLENNNVESVVFNNNKIEITPKDNNGNIIKVKYWTTELNDPELIQELKEKYTQVKFKGEQQSSSSSLLLILLEWVLPFVMFYVLLTFIMKKAGGGAGGGMFGVGKSNAKVYVQKETGVTFKDVAGQEEAKESVVELVDFLHNPGKYTEIGAKLPKGALLVGPPGTGKTLLAKAVAGEAKVPFFSLSGSDFVEMFVGVGASRVRDLFKQAEQNAPCIVFIDEIDSIGKSRDSRYGGGNDEREQTLNQLLAEMDGFSSDANPVIVLAATNRPEVLDAALLRPGRFDRQVLVDKPDFKGRIEILNVHSKDIKLSKSVDLEEIARLTAGLAGADLANIINEAALLAGRNEKNYVEQNDLVEAVERAIAGLEKKSRRINPKEKRIVAYHECGHALISETTKGADKVTKVSIIPRGLAALGYTLNTPEENKFLMQKHELYAMIDVLLGGRAAEEIFIKEISTGASNDLERATDIVKSMVSMYGMSDFDIAGLMVLEKQRNMFLNGGQALKDYSDDMAKKLDDYVKQTLDERYKSVLETLRTYAGAIEEMVKALYENETIEGEKVREIIKNFEIKNDLPSRLQQDDEKGEGDL